MPVRVKKMQKNKELEHFRASEKRGNALEPGPESGMRVPEKRLPRRTRDLGASRQPEDRE
jgi:hypothetical protein